MTSVSFGNRLAGLAVLASFVVTSRCADAAVLVRGRCWNGATKTPQSGAVVHLCREDGQILVSKVTTDDGAFVVESAVTGNLVLVASWHEQTHRVAIDAGAGQQDRAVLVDIHFDDSDGAWASVWKLLCSVLLNPVWGLVLAFLVGLATEHIHKRRSVNGLVAQARFLCNRCLAVCAELYQITDQLWKLPGSEEIQRRELELRFQALIDELKPLATRLETCGLEVSGVYRVAKARGLQDYLDFVQAGRVLAGIAEGRWGFAAPEWRDASSPLRSELAKLKNNAFLYR